MKIAIKSSNIHGQGVFAEKDIRRGEIIIDWNGCAEFLNNQEIEALPDDERQYLSIIDGRHILFKPPARFVNHSCNPNARGANGQDVAIRDIGKGEEITVDYVVEQVPGLNLQCNCGTSSCREFLKVAAQPPRGSETARYVMLGANSEVEPRSVDLMNIRQRLDDERRHLVRTGEIIEVGPLVTRLQNDSRHSIVYSSLTAENADETVAQEIEHHRQLGVPFEWKLYSHDTPSDLLERLQRNGLIVGSRETVMVYDMAGGCDAWPKNESPRTILRIIRPDHLADYRRVAEEVFEKNYDFTVAQLAESIAAGSTEHQGYVAYSGVEPVSVGRLYTHPESLFAGLYGGGTRKDFRGQGFYREVVAARARDAAVFGSRYLMVDALPTSLPILERLGFERLTDTWPCEWHP